MVGLAILCAVVAAGCSALGAMWQHAGVRETTGLKLTSAYRLMSSRRWVYGFLILVACAILQVIALGRPSPTRSSRPGSASSCSTRARP